MPKISAMMKLTVKTMIGRVRANLDFMVLVVEVQNKEDDKSGALERAYIHIVGYSRPEFLVVYPLQIGS